MCSFYPFVDRAPISAIFKTRTLGEYFTTENQPNALTKCSTCYKNAGKGLDDGSSHLMVSNQDIPYMWYPMIFDQLKILPSALYFKAWTTRQVRGKGMITYSLISRVVKGDDRYTEPKNAKSNVNITDLVILSSYYCLKCSSFIFLSTEKLGSSA